MAQTGNNISVTTTPAAIFTASKAGGSDGTPGIAFKVFNRGSTDLRVNIPVIHGAGNYGTLPAGQFQVYRSAVGDRGLIDTINVKTDSGSTEIDYEPVDRVVG